MKQLVGGYYNGSTGKKRRRLITMVVEAEQRLSEGISSVLSVLGCFILVYI